MSGLSAYLSELVAWGAGAAELVLHHGPASEHVRFVHVIEPDWQATFAQYRARGIACHAHASVAPAFRIEGWRADPDGVRRQYRPLLDCCAWMAEQQGAAVTLVLHGAGDVRATRAQNRETTRGFLAWAEREIEARGGGVRIAVELLRARGADDAHASAGRANVLALVRECNPAHVGICWDVEHDWFNGRRDPAWTPEPPPEFLDRVIHVHVHDAHPTTHANHFPLAFGTVPYDALVPFLVARGYRGPFILELRYRHALALGDPHAWMGKSYAVLHTLLTKRGREPGAGHRQAG